MHEVDGERLGLQVLHVVDSVGGGKDAEGDGETLRVDAADRVGDGEPVRWDRERDEGVGTGDGVAVPLPAVWLTVHSRVAVRLDTVRLRKPVAVLVELSFRDSVEVPLTDWGEGEAVPGAVHDAVRVTLDCVRVRAGLQDRDPDSDLLPRLGVGVAVGAGVGEAVALRVSVGVPGGVRVPVAETVSVMFWREGECVTDPLLGVKLSVRVRVGTTVGVSVQVRLAHHDRVAVQLRVGVSVRCCDAVDVAEVADPDAERLRLAAREQVAVGCRLTEADVERADSVGDGVWLEGVWVKL